MASTFESGDFHLETVLTWRKGCCDSLLTLFATCVELHLSQEFELVRRLGILSATVITEGDPQMSTDGAMTTRTVGKPASVIAYAANYISGELRTSQLVALQARCRTMQLQMRPVQCKSQAASISHPVVVSAAFVCVAVTT